MRKNVNSYDIDGVIFLDGYEGVYPGPDDLIVTGRSIEEARDTLAMLASRRITNPVFFNNRPFVEKTRESSGYHKVQVLSMLISSGFQVGVHFEDDEIQKQIIEQAELPLKVVHFRHDLSDKENVRRCFASL